MNALLFLGFLDVMNAKEKYAILLELITGWDVLDAIP
jgi:hypothetical protein